MVIGQVSFLILPLTCLLKIVFLVNSSPSLFIDSFLTITPSPLPLTGERGGYDSKRNSLLRTYGAILPSSLRGILPFALVYSTHPLELVLVQFTILNISCLSFTPLRGGDSPLSPVRGRGGGSMYLRIYPST